MRSATALVQTEKISLLKMCHWLLHRRRAPTQCLWGGIEGVHCSETGALVQVHNSYRQGGSHPCKETGYLKIQWNAKFTRNQTLYYTKQGQPVSLVTAETGSNILSEYWWIIIKKLLSIFIRPNDGTILQYIQTPWLCTFCFTKGRKLYFHQVKS